MHKVKLDIEAFRPIIEKIEKDSGCECVVALIALPANGGNPDILANIPPQPLYDLLEWMVDNQDATSAARHEVPITGKPN